MSLPGGKLFSLGQTLFTFVEPLIPSKWDGLQQWAQKGIEAALAVVNLFANEPFHRVILCHLGTVLSVTAVPALVIIPGFTHIDT